MNCTAFLTRCFRNPDSDQYGSPQTRRGNPTTCMSGTHPANHGDGRMTAAIIQLAAIGAGDVMRSGVRSVKSCCRLAGARRGGAYSSATFTTSLPKFLPCSSPMNASGARSSPSTTSSR